MIANSLYRAINFLSQRRRGFLPRLELLETRELPAVMILDGFAGISYREAPGTIPPNPHIAVGHDYLVQTVNNGMKVDDRNTGESAVILFRNLFSALPPGRSYMDTYALYDEVNRRFLVATMVGNLDPTQPSRLYLAVSDADDPRAGFSEQHHFDVTQFAGKDEYRPGNFSIGGNAEVVVVAFDMFRRLTPTSGIYDHLQTLSLERSTLLDYDPSTLSESRADLQTLIGLQVAAMHDPEPDAPIWMAARDTRAPSTLLLVRMTDALTGVPQFTQFRVSVERYDWRIPRAPQPKGPALQTCGGSLLGTAWRNGRLVAAQDVLAGAVGHVRWYEIDTTGAVPVLSQEGEIDAGPDVFTYCGAIAVAADGSLGLTYTQSSPTEYLSMYVTGRSAKDKLGTMQESVLVAAGKGSSEFLAAGHHGGIGVDPRDGATFWAINAYQPQQVRGSWWTWVSAFVLGEGSAPGGGQAAGLLATRPTPHHAAASLEFQRPVLAGTDRDTALALFSQGRIEGVLADSDFLSEEEDAQAWDQLSWVSALLETPDKPGG